MSHGTHDTALTVGQVFEWMTVGRTTLLNILEWHLRAEDGLLLRLGWLVVDWDKRRGHAGPVFRRI
jgi:hypothetical protein